MTMETDISILHPQDLDHFYPVFTGVLRSEFPCYDDNALNALLNGIYTRNNFEFWLREKTKIVLTAREKNNMTVVGFALIDEPYGGVSLCRWLGVVKSHQRKGIGSRLILRWEEEAVKGNCHKMELAAQPDAKDFYMKAGLTCEGFRKRSYFGADQYVFGKLLA